ncbi:hypothetical protein OEA41_006689 [Lepraria neglecta]|uniref:Histone H1 n=1 Tax=Lepraria neglecta TaxID=209136 RepID=A0AAD9Z895_9LECA|nr:hypothetical protein OEA41_006689 [Lepraria neglecta]
MPAKKATGAAPAKKTAVAPQHAKYKDMIKEAIMAKYILANNKNVTPSATFDTLFNRAIKGGVEKGEFAQPKGTSGTVKLAKKDSATAPKATTTKSKTSTKPKTTKATTKKATVTKTKPGPKKATTATKSKAKPAAKTANTGAKRTKKTPVVAPAIVEEKKVLGKTKSGRVTKGPAKQSNPVKSKKPAGKGTKAKSTPKKPASTPSKATPAAT